MKLTVKELLVAFQKEAVHLHVVATFTIKSRVIQLSATLAVCLLRNGDNAQMLNTLQVTSSYHPRTHWLQGLKSLASFTADSNSFLVFPFAFRLL